MKPLYRIAYILLIAASSLCAQAQVKFITDAPPDKRLKIFWTYCYDNLIATRDSAVVNNFLDDVVKTADSLKDEELKSFALYFQQCFRILFAGKSEIHIDNSNFKEAIKILDRTQQWAIQNRYEVIAASCEHDIGQVYYLANRYGLAFDHLLKADDLFRKIGYQHVPNGSYYLCNLGLHFYQFEEYDKALSTFLEATKYEFYFTRSELNTLNTIGLIYARKNDPEKAGFYYRSTMEKAMQNGDLAWVGIASGNLGNVFLAGRQYDSALFYHLKNFHINVNMAPEDAAKSALSIAASFVGKYSFDSALNYTNLGVRMAESCIRDSIPRLDFRRRTLKVLIDYSKAKGNFQQALLLTDSLNSVENKLAKKMDNNILNRAIEKRDAMLYNEKEALLKSHKHIAQLRMYFFIATLVILLILIFTVLRDNWLSKKRNLRFGEKDKQILLSEKLKAEDGLKHAEELLKAYIDTIKEKSTLISQLESELNELKKTASNSRELVSINLNMERLMASTILTDQDWQQFKVLFEQVYPGFSYRLKMNYPELTPAEARFLYLTKLNLSSKEMATMLGISTEAIHKSRYRLRKKLQMEEDGNIQTVIQKIN